MDRRLGRIVVTATLAASLTLPTLPAAASEKSPSVARPLPTPTWLSGTVEVNGCRLQPSQIRLGALPVSPAIGTERATTIDGRAVVRRAVVLRTSDPYAFTFLVLGLRPRVSYQLEIGVPPSPCGRVFWRGPLGGLTAPGQSRLSIEGFAATSQLEILDPVTDAWVGMDNLGFDDPRTGTREFRWRSSVTGETGGELQIATAPFPVGVDACAEPEEGILLRQDVPRSGGAWAAVPPIDFNALLLPSRDPDGRVPGEPRTTPVTADLIAQMLIGAPLYARVVPRDGRGPACDAKQQGVGGWVVMAQVPSGTPLIAEPAPPALEAGDDHTYEPPSLYFGNDGNIHPTYDDQAFILTKDHVMPTKLWCQYGNNIFDPTDPPGSVLDWYGCMLVNADAISPGATLPAGARFYYIQTTTSSGGGGFIDSLVSFGESVGDIVTAGVTAVGLGVDFLAKLYEDAKEAVEAVVQNVIMVVPGLGQLCSAYPEECKAAIQTGVTTGLAAMGLPPSVPNWDQLKQQGVDYLAAEVASQTGVPPEIADEFVERALATAQEAVDEMTANRGLSTQVGYNWLIPYFGTDPAVLTIDIRRNDPDPFPVPLFLRRFASVPFAAGVLRIPSTFVANPTHLRMPMVLPPNLAGIGAPLCSHYLNGERVCGASPFVSQPTCRYQVGTINGPQWEYSPCQDKVVAVYYRTEWINKLALGCTILSVGAQSPASETTTVQTPTGPKQVSKFVWSNVPGYSFAVGGLVQPPGPAFTWSGAFGVGPGC